MTEEARERGGALRLRRRLPHRRPHAGLLVRARRLVVHGLRQKIFSITCRWPRRRWWPSASPSSPPSCTCAATRWDRLGVVSIRLGLVFGLLVMVTGHDLGPGRVEHLVDLGAPSHHVSDSLLPVRGLLRAARDRRRRVAPRHLRRRVRDHRLHRRARDLLRHALRAREPASDGHGPRGEAGMETACSWAS